MSEEFEEVIISRWLAKDPDVLIMDEPTRGIDVGAKYEIYSIIGDLAKRGKTIIVISSEMPELIGIADRIMVMCVGKITGIVEGKDMKEVFELDFHGRKLSVETGEIAKQAVNGEN